MWLVCERCCTAGRPRVETAATEGGRSRAPEPALGSCRLLVRDQADAPVSRVGQRHSRKATGGLSQLFADSGPTRHRLSGRGRALACDGRQREIRSDVQSITKCLRPLCRSVLAVREHRRILRNLRPVSASLAAHDLRYSERRHLAAGAQHDRVGPRFSAGRASSELRATQ
jgi:hypothetical protein